MYSPPDPTINEGWTPFDQIGDPAYLEKAPKRARKWILREATHRARLSAKRRCATVGRWHIVWTSPADFLNLRPDIVAILPGMNVAEGAALVTRGKIVRYLFLTGLKELPATPEDERRFMLAPCGIIDEYNDGDVDIALDAFDTARLI